MVVVFVRLILNHAFPFFIQAAKEEEKKDQEEEEEETEEAEKPSKKQQSKVDFKMTSFIGSNNGEPFDHRNHRHVKEITIIAGMMVDGLHVNYGDGFKREHGGKGGITQGDAMAKPHTISLGADEYIVSAFVRADPNSFVQALGFTTNKGKNFGPFGGNGRPFKDKKGQEHNLSAPAGYRLTGLAGKADKTHITAIAFRWGPISH